VVLNGLQARLTWHSAARNHLDTQAVLCSYTCKASTAQAHLLGAPGGCRCRVRHLRELHKSPSKAAASSERAHTNGELPRVRAGAGAGRHVHARAGASARALLLPGGHAAGGRAAAWPRGSGVARARQRGAVAARRPSRAPAAAAAAALDAGAGAGAAVAAAAAAALPRVLRAHAHAAAHERGAGGEQELRRALALRDAAAGVAWQA
jgi:hypothetical protein